MWSIWCAGKRTTNHSHAQMAASDEWFALGSITLRKWTEYDSLLWYVASKDGAVRGRSAGAVRPGKDAPPHCAGGT
jgi:hypothetical protein